MSSLSAIWRFPNSLYGCLLPLTRHTLPQSRPPKAKHIESRRTGKTAISLADEKQKNLGRSTDDVLAPASVGYYIALRVGFAFPLEELNELPKAWVDHYTQNRFMLHDPVIRWIYGNNGSIRWSELDLPDPMRVLEQAQVFGLRYGAAVACFDGNREGQRSFGTFVRADREFTDEEILQFQRYVEKLHRAKAPPTNLTAAEIEALGMVKRGLRLKQVAHELGVTEGAIKQRLKNAKTKLNAQTSAQAAAMASEFGLI